MPVTYAVVPGENTVRMEFSEPYRVQETTDAARALAKEPWLVPGMHLLIDSSECGHVPDQEGVRLTLALFSDLGLLKNRRVAMLVAGDAAFGMARMFSALAELGGLVVEPFRNIAHARQWLAGKAEAVA